MTVLFTLAVLFPIFGGCLAIAVKASVTQQTSSGRKKISKAGRLVIKEFKRLPQANRPYPLITLIDCIAALDAGYGISKVNQEYLYKDYEAAYFSWRSGSGACPEYYHLFNAIKDIRDAVAAQQKALEVANLAHCFDRALELTEALRQESKIIKQVTKDLV